ncbi:hypothetical protein, partial [Rickettsiales endosymbiont of Trichoplax sp. H2]|uniref:hypothetical protein n=1 Tax=Rickettsiales endosymbiont of Trichoplax sp. H2 TaxID=2021221 RepID=UPI0012B3B6A5
METKTCDRQLWNAVRKNNLEMVKRLVESGKCSQEVIKKLLFNQYGYLQKSFNGIKEELIKNNHLDKNLLEGLISKEEINELSEKYQAQQEWRIKEDC